VRLTHNRRSSRQDLGHRCHANIADRTPELRADDPAVHGNDQWDPRTDVLHDQRQPQRHRIISGAHHHRVDLVIQRLADLGITGMQQAYHLGGGGIQRPLGGIGQFSRPDEKYTPIGRTIG
jgi:hypothetical protein